MTGDARHRPGRIRILSDLHLGHPATRVREVESLRPLLEGVSEVVFNGDTFEQSVDEWSTKGKKQFAQLRELCAGLGVKPHFLAGNHDLWLEGNRWREFLGERVFVTHGDMILPTVAPWNRECLARRDRVRDLLHAFGDDVSTLELLERRTLLVEEATIPDRDPGLGEEGRGFFLSAFWPPRRPYHMLLGWLTMYAKAGRFVERYRPACRVFVFGHFHRPGVRRRKGRILCNTGAFMKGARPFLVDLEGEKVVMRSIKVEDSTAFRPGELHAEFAI